METREQLPVSQKQKIVKLVLERTCVMEVLAQGEHVSLRGQRNVLGILRFVALGVLSLFPPYSFLLERAEIFGPVEEIA